MPRALSRLVRIVLCVVGGIAAGAVACVDTTRPRDAQNDVTELRFELVAIQDTVRQLGDWALVHLRTLDGLYHDYPVEWSSTPAGYLTPFGNGGFRLEVLPAAPTVFTVRANVLGRTSDTFVVYDP